MVFAHVPGERAPQKPRHPFGVGAFLIPIPGHLSALFAAKSVVIPQDGKANRWWFFPGRGRAGGNGGGPRRPSPLNRGKTKGRTWGHGWLSSSHIRPVSYRVFKGCTKCMPTIKSGSIARSSPKSRRFPSAALRGLWVFPCPRLWIR
jgi:hypothetical protein